MKVRRKVCAVIAVGRGAFRPSARSAFAAATAGAMTLRLTLRRSRRAPSRRERGFVRLGVGPGSAVGEQLVVQPRRHVDLADARLGFGVADIDHAVGEVKVADVQVAGLGVGRPAQPRVARIARRTFARSMLR